MLTRIRLPLVVALVAASGAGSPSSVIGATSTASGWAVYDTLSGPAGATHLEGTPGNVTDGDPSTTYVVVQDQPLPPGSGPSITVKLRPAGGFGDLRPVKEIRVTVYLGTPLQISLFGASAYVGIGGGPQPAQLIKQWIINASTVPPGTTVAAGQVFSWSSPTPVMMDDIYVHFSASSLNGSTLNNPIGFEEIEIIEDAAPVDVSFWPTANLTTNSDGWPSENPTQVRVTLRCPLGGGACSYPLSVDADSSDGGRFYFYDRPYDVPVDGVLCSQGARGSEFSQSGFGAACWQQSSPFGYLTLSAGESRTLYWNFWVQPSEAATLHATANWGPFSGQKTLTIPRAAVHPVVLIHGILGSMPPQDKLITNQADAGDVLDPFTGIYTPLLLNLQKMGYEWNRTLFGLAYDWRNTNALSAGFFAEKLVETILPNAGKVKYSAADGMADLVVHSMGGLVARTYIQGFAFSPTTFKPIPFPDAPNLRKVVFIATPHKGFPFDYRTREGLTWRDYLYNSPTGPWLAIHTMDNLIWPTLILKEFIPTEAELDRDCELRFELPVGDQPPEVMIPVLRGPFVMTYHCHADTLAAWAHHPTRGARSLLEMLPAEGTPVYLVNEDGDPSGPPPDWPWGHEANPFLNGLNQSVDLLVSRLGDPQTPDNIYVIYGKGAAETDLKYEVKAPGNNLWRFGAVTEDSDVLRETPAGDDLIPSDSASMDGLLDLPWTQKIQLDAAPPEDQGGARHKGIMFHPQTQGTWVPRFLAGLVFPVTTPYSAPSVQLGKALSIISGCPINLMVTDPQGRRLGYEPSSGQVLREIPDSLYTQPGVEPQIVQIRDAVPGEYHFTVAGYGDGPYNFRVDQEGDTGSVPLAVFFGQTAPGQVASHDWTLADNSPPGAVADVFTLGPGGALDVDAPGVLGNDVELDGEPMTAVLVKEPEHGHVNLRADGSFSYVAGPGFAGSDRFTYRASDGRSESNEVPVRLRGEIHESLFEDQFDRPDSTDLGPAWEETVGDWSIVKGKLHTGTRGDPCSGERPCPLRGEDDDTREEHRAATAFRPSPLPPPIPPRSFRKETLTRASFEAVAFTLETRLRLAQRWRWPVGLFPIPWRGDFGAELSFGRAPDGVGGYRVVLDSWDRVLLLRADGRLLGAGGAGAKSRNAWRQVKVARGEDGLMEVWVDEGGGYPKEPQIRAMDGAYPRLGRLGLGLRGMGSALDVDWIVARPR